MSGQINCFKFYILSNLFTKDIGLSILFGCLVLSKHTIGVPVFLCTCFGLRNWKRIWKRVEGCLIPGVLFVLYLLLTGSFVSFFDLCFLGLFDFGGNNRLLIPWCIILGIVSFLATLYGVRKDSKNMLKESEDAIMDKDLLDVVVESDINEIKESDPEILAVYKECAEGHITEEQREDIITSIRNQRSASAIIKEAQVDEDSTLKDKFNEIKRIAYERCENGEFSEDTREEIINAAYNKLFNATEEVDIDKAEPVKDNPAETKKEIDEMNKNIDKEINANKA